MNIELLKKEIDEQNFTLEHLALKSGVNKSTISRVLNGTGCTIETAQKLVKGLNLDKKKAFDIFLG